MSEKQFIIKFGISILFPILIILAARTTYLTIEMNHRLQNNPIFQNASFDMQVEIKNKTREDITCCGGMLNFFVLGLVFFYSLIFGFLGITIGKRLQMKSIGEGLFFGGIFTFIIGGIYAMVIIQQFLVIAIFIGIIGLGIYLSLTKRTRRRERLSSLLEKYINKNQ